MTSHRNFGQPSPPMDKSHGGGPCHSSEISNSTLQIKLGDDLLFPFFFEIFGFLSDSFSKSFSPYLLTTFSRDSSIGKVLLCWDLRTIPSSEVIFWEMSEQAVARTISKAPEKFILKIFSHLSSFARISFNPRFETRREFGFGSMRLSIKSPAMTKIPQMEYQTSHQKYKVNEQYPQSVSVNVEVSNLWYEKQRYFSLPYFAIQLLKVKTNW